MSKTEQRLIDAKEKQKKLIEKKDKLIHELSTINGTITSLEKQLKREKINEGIIRIEASGFTIDDILEIMKNEKVLENKEDL